MTVDTKIAEVRSRVRAYLLIVRYTRPRTVRDDIVVRFPEYSGDQIDLALESLIEDGLVSRYMGVYTLARPDRGVIELDDSEIVDDDDRSYGPCGRPKRGK